MSSLEEHARIEPLSDGPVVVRGLPDVDELSAVDLTDSTERNAPGRLQPFARAMLAALPAATIVVLSTSKTGGLEVALLWAVWFFVIRRMRCPVWLRPLAPGLPLAAVCNAAVGLIVASLISLWSPGVSLTPAALLVVAAMTFVAAAGLDLAFSRVLAGRTRTLIVGGGEAGSALVDELRKHPKLHPGTVLMVHDDRWEGFESTIVTEEPDVVVTATDAPEVVRSILDAGVVDVRVIGLHGFYEHVLGRVPVDGLPPRWFMSVLHLYQRPYSRFRKRAFDCVLAVVSLILVAPVLAATALLVRLSSSGSILFRQVRLGEGGKPFEVVKFRTMVEGAELPGAPRWAAVDDPRITRAGRLLRRSHLDELPQLWNVLRGEMSIVGPRPERPEFLGLLEREVPFWTRRHLMKPGITGWAQVQGGYASDVASAKEKLSYDLYYLKHQSLALDLAIAVKTVVVAIGSALVSKHDLERRRARPSSAPFEAAPTPIRAPLTAEKIRSRWHGRVVANPDSRDRKPTRAAAHESGRVQAGALDEETPAPEPVVALAADETERPLFDPGELTPAARRR